MSFEVLARKWRPQTFDEVVGQEHITYTLKKSVQSGRIVHAYLFSGPRGCGKTSTARIMAKVINCTDLKDGNPCNACPSCLGVIEGKNLDVMEIDGATHTGVAEVRDLQESIGYTPSQYRNKVYIIDEVHMLSTNAFNALLKTLEEPPRHVYFIFATTAPHKIPETIKSRCQRHNFKRLEIKEIARQLQKICEAEGVKYEEEALRLLARKAEGSMRDGESLLDQCITASSGDVGTAAVRSILGFLDQELVFSFLELLAGRDPTEVLRKLDAVVDEGVDLQELSYALLEGFRDLMILAAPGDLESILLRSQDEVERLRGLLEHFELPDLVTIVERLCTLGPRLKSASDPRILLEATLVDLALLDRQTDIRTLIKKIEDMGGGAPSGRGGARRIGRAGGGEEAAGAGSAKVARDMGTAFFYHPGGGTRPAEASSRPVDPYPTSGGGAGKEEAPATEQDGFRAEWDRFITAVRQKKVALGVCLISGKLVRFDDGKVYLRYDKRSNPQREEVENAANMKFLGNMMEKHLGRRLEIICLGEDEEIPPAKDEEKSGPRAGKKIEDLPLTRKILRDFDGEIIHY
jgi:DNA polymerase-3 subunit gamma/tau